MPQALFRVRYANGTWNCVVKCGLPLEILESRCESCIPGALARLLEANHFHRIACLCASIACCGSHCLEIFEVCDSY